jgi:CII-binding regulator of phage lambda lysogenization HflD
MSSSPELVVRNSTARSGSFSLARRRLRRRQVHHLPVEDQHVVAVLAQLRQNVFGSLETVANVAGRGQHLADQISLAAVVVEYGNSHTAACWKNVKEKSLRI